MQLYVFIVITVLLIVKPTITATFVSELGAESLPVGYLLTAIVAVITAYYYSIAIKKHSLVKITLLSLSLFSIAFILFGVIIFFNIINIFSLYFYYVFVSLFALVATSQFWIFANMVFNTREAKRIFGFIGAGAIAGGIFGGYLTNILSSFFGNEFTILTAALLILFCIPILRKIYLLRISDLTNYKRKQVIDDKNKLESSSLQIIKNSKHLTYIALITGISVIVAKLIDYQFSDFASQKIDDSDELAAFFGFWFSTFNVLGLIIQLFLTNKIVNRLGVSSSLLILPLAIGFGSLLFITFPELWVLIIIKGIDGSFKQSINKAAVELSIMPIETDIKNQAKSYIDVAIDSIATGLAGFLLIFLVRNLSLAPSVITVIILLFIFIWILLIYRLREAYFKSFKNNIQNSIKTDTQKKDRFKKDNLIFDIEKVFKSGDEKAILNMFDKIKDYKLKSIKKAVVELLKHPSYKVKIAAIEYLYLFNDENILQEVEKLVYNNNYNLVFTALNYTLHHKQTDEINFFNKYLNHQSEYIANCALLSLAKQSEYNKLLASNYNLEARLKEKIEIYNAKPHIKKEIIAGLMLSIAYSKQSDFYHIISQNLKNNKNYIAKYATIAAGITTSEVFIKDLLEQIQNRKLRKYAIKSLKNYSSKIIDKILELEITDELLPATRRFIPRVISSFENENAVNVLLNILKSNNASSRLEAIKSLKIVARKNPSLSIATKPIKKLLFSETAFYQNVLQINTSLQINIKSEILEHEINEEDPIYKAKKAIENALNSELDKSFKIIFYTLQFLFDSEDITTIYKGLRNENSEAKVNAIELLDNILLGKIKENVLPIVEHHVKEVDHYKSEIIKFDVLTELEYLPKLMDISGSNVRRITIEYIALTKNKAFLPALLPLRKYINSGVKKLAYETIYEIENS